MIDNQLKQAAQDVINLLLRNPYNSKGLNRSDYNSEIGQKLNIKGSFDAIKEYLLNMGIIQMDRPVGNENNGRVIHSKFGLEKYQDVKFIEYQDGIVQDDKKLKLKEHEKTEKESNRESLNEQYLQSQITANKSVVKYTKISEDSYKRAGWSLIISIIAIIIAAVDIYLKLFLTQ